MDFLKSGGVDPNNWQEELKKINANKLSAEDMKELGGLEGEEEDPELKELEKEAKNYTFNPKTAQKGELSEADLDKMEVKDEDLNDPDLMKELEAEVGEDLDMGSEDKSEEEKAKEKIATINQEIKKCISSARDFKKKGQTGEAIKFLKQKKALDQEKAKIVEKFPSLAPGAAPAAAPAPTAPKPPEAKKPVAAAPKKPAAESKPKSPKKEEKRPTTVEKKESGSLNIGDVSKMTSDEIELRIHNHDKLAAVSVMDAEMELLKEKMTQVGKDDAALLEEKRGQIEFRRNMLVGNIEAGLVSQEKYMADIQLELKYEKMLHEALKKEHAKPEDIKRVEKRISLINQELSGGPPPEESAKSPEPPAKAEEKKSEPEAKKPAPALAPEKPKGQAPPEAANPVQEAQKEKKQETSPEHSPVSRPPPILEDEVVDFTKVNKMQYDTVSNRMKDYQQAIEYFINNGMQKQADKFMKKLERLKDCLKVIKSGKKIDLIRIDPPLTPEIMFDMDIEARVKTFQALTDKLQAQLSQQKALAKEFIDKSKKEKAFKGLAEKHVQKAEENSRLLSQVREVMKNQWQPVPLFHMQMVQEDREVIQEDIAPNELVIDFTPDPKMAGKTDYHFDYVVASKDEVQKGTFDAFKKNEVHITMAKSIKHLERAEASLTLTGKSMLLFTKNLGGTKLKLDKFAKQGKIPVEFSDEDKKYKMTAVFMIRRPTKSKEFVKEEHKELVIDHVYPAFRSPPPKSPAAPHPASRASVAVTKRPLEEQKTKKSNSQIAPQKGGDPPLPSPLPDLPKILREIDVKDPDDVGNLVCSSYLEKKIASYMAAIKQMSDKGHKIPQPMSDKLTAMTKNQAILTSQIDSGKLAPETYKKYLDGQLRKDQVLLSYLKGLNQKSKMAIVMDRIICIQKELKSL